ncbi:MAG TPA: OmpA family protein [Hanamia sp.]|nr:OmpA family protein [Hanamia sp.]
MKKFLLLFFALPLMFISCVSTKKFKAAKADYAQLQAKYKTDLDGCNTAKDQVSQQNASLQSQNDALNKQLADQEAQIAFLKKNNTAALQQLQDLSVISSSQAESIKKSLDNLGAKDAYIRTLQQAMARKDSLNMNLVMNLKGAIGDVSNNDIDIKVVKGVVYINISDKLLFRSGKYEVTKQARAVLGEVAQVLKNQPDITFMVEGNTDNVPYHQGVLLDNWDLSVKRATSVVRILQNKYGLDPAKIVAAGRGQYHPLVDNSTAANRALNRRTTIIILPQLDQFFNLLEPKQQ